MFGRKMKKMRSVNAANFESGIDLSPFGGKLAKEGDILGPLPTLRGQAFLKVIDIADVVMSDFEEKKDAIRFSLLIDRQNAIWGNWLQALRDNADLKDYRYDFY